MTEFVLTTVQLNDAPQLKTLYQAVAALTGGLARSADEITDAYIQHFLQKSLQNGLILVARHDQTDTILGEIHTYGSGIKVFAHVLGELTIAVHPAHQGQGIGKALFKELLTQVRLERPDILRVELIARESNQKAIQFYQQLGFCVEGRLEQRIRSSDGHLEADIPMAWYRQAL